MQFSMRPFLWDSAVTFRRGTVEKASFVLLSQLDIIVTIFALYFGFCELNPLMRSLLDSPIQLLLAKCAVPIFIAWAMPGKLLLPSIAILFFSVGWNLKEMLLCLL